MSPISLKALASLAAFLSLSNAHMMMNTPIPMGKSTLNNSPLAGDGSDFPCKLRGDSTWDTSAGVNNFAAGGSYPLSFIGSAVHGGGSCQVSLTTDKEPTKDSKWMVIKSIEGGCPATADGNLPADPNGNGASTFQYTIPADMPAGDYTIAWTWNNRIGNREMYMNCGRAVIGGAKKKRYAPTPKTSVFKRDNYPDMFVANIGNHCGVIDNTNVIYPNPGAELQRVASTSMAAPTGSGCPAPTGGASSPSSDAPAVSSAAPAVSTATVQPIPSSSAAPSVSGGIFATVTASPSASGAAAPSAASSAASSAAQPTAAASTTAAAPVATGTSSGSVSGIQSGACSNEGAWSCAPDGMSFQRCASGMWSAPMQMAAGMSCTPGVSNTFSMNAIGHAAKRDLRSHINRRRHANVIS